MLRACQSQLTAACSSLRQQHTINQGDHVGQGRMMAQAAQVAFIVGGEGGAHPPAGWLFFNFANYQEL